MPGELIRLAQKQCLSLTRPDVLKQLTKTVVETALSTAGPAPPHLRVSPRRRPVPGVGDEDR